VDQLFDRRIIFVGGKGGVGKTTTAGALALMAAESGRSTLLVSTDPAHSLGDVFDTRIGNEETSLGRNLSGLEIDPEAEAESHIATVKMSMKSLVAPKMYKEIDRQLELTRYSPGTMEAALLERMADLMAEARGRFDLLIFDTAPSGHTIRLLSLPEVLGAWSDGMLGHRDRSRKLGELLNVFGRDHSREDEFGMIGGSKEEPDNSRDGRIQDILLTRRRKFHRARELLTDPAITAFLLVINAERLPILESKKTLDLLDRFNIPVTGMIVNRLLPPEADGEFLRERRLQEDEYRAEIDQTFAGLRRIYLNLLPHDVHGLETLRKIGKAIMEQLGDGGGAARAF
jgi:arsenite-transporting ATPase|tara:strand:- start:1763 stop:2791 length:1029 start_codon:yes stop_codon:yes gene_type:complete